MGWGTYAQALLALIFVVGLIAVLAVLARRYGLGVRTPTIGSRNKRVQVVEVTILDGKRRLVLVRRDDKEHLILLGATSEHVIEAGIPAAGRFADALARQDTEPGGNGDRWPADDNGKDQP